MTGEPAARSARVLIAGVGNIFRSDDAFGVEVVRLLTEPDCRWPVPDDVEVVDVGIRGMHLAYQLLDGYQALVLIDTTSRGGAPGQLYLLEHSLDRATRNASGPAPDVPTAVPDAHDMGPDTVLALLGALAAAAGLAPTAGLRRVLVVGCEPAVLADGIGLSEPVAAALEGAVQLVAATVDELLTQLPQEVPS
ncbi:MAG TPA: hydrogenase maturation protease [Acidimicrobiales bacterium]